MLMLGVMMLLAAGAAAQPPVAMTAAWRQAHGACVLRCLDLTPRESIQCVNLCETSIKVVEPQTTTTSTTTNITCNSTCLKIIRHKVTMRIVNETVREAQAEAEQMRAAVRQRYPKLHPKPVAFHKGHEGKTKYVVRPLKLSKQSKVFKRLVRVMPEDMRDVLEAKVLRTLQRPLKLPCRREPKTLPSGLAHKLTEKLMDTLPDEDQQWRLKKELAKTLRIPVMPHNDKRDGY